MLRGRGAEVAKPAERGRTELGERELGERSEQGVQSRECAVGRSTDRRLPNMYDPTGAGYQSDNETTTKEGSRMTDMGAG